MPACQGDKGIAFTNGTTFATASSTGDACVWDLDGDKLTLFEHPDALNDICFNAQGSVLLTACNDGNVYLWDTLKSEMICTIGLLGQAYRVAINPQCTRIVTSSLGADVLSLWSFDSASGEVALIRSLISNSPTVMHTLAWHHEGNAFVTATHTNEWFLWTNDGKDMRNFGGCKENIVALEVGDREDQFLIACEAGKAHYVDVSARKVAKYTETGDIHLLTHPPKGVLYAVSDKQKLALRKLYDQPTLEHILLRIVLADYAVGCAGSGKKIAFEDSQALLCDVSRACNVQQTAVINAWNTIDPLVQKSILRTLLRSTAKATSKRAMDVWSIVNRISWVFLCAILMEHATQISL